MALEREQRLYQVRPQALQQLKELEDKYNALKAGTKTAA
jgi:hypothetical protein